MSQLIEVGDKDLEKVDNLVKRGVFLSREHVVKAGLESLLELPEEEIEKMKLAQVKVSGYCDSHLGNMLGGGVPARVLVNGKEYFKVPVKGEYKSDIYTYGHLFVDADTFAIDERLSDSPKKIHSTALELTGENESPLL